MKTAAELTVESAYTAYDNVLIPCLMLLFSLCLVLVNSLAEPAEVRVIILLFYVIIQGQTDPINILAKHRSRNSDFDQTQQQHGFISTECIFYSNISLRFHQ